MAETYSFGHWGSTSEEILKRQFPLHCACRDGNVERLSLLLVDAQHGIYEEDSFYGWTPAHWAAYFGKLGCLRKLMTVNHHRVGVNSNLRTSRFRQTPAHLSAFGGHPTCLLWLLQSEAEIDSQDYLGETPIHKAARTCSMECISLLTAHGARLYIQNNNGHTPAEVAKMCGHEDCSVYLQQASLRQEAEAKGIYEERPRQQFAITAPSPHDVTAKSQPLPAGINAYMNAMSSESEETAMDEEMEEGAVGGVENDPQGTVNGQQPMTNGHSSNGTRSGHLMHMYGGGDCGQSNDITLSMGVSSNTVPVGGRKRSREDDQHGEFKRRRAEAGWCRNEGSGCRLDGRGVSSSVLEHQASLIMESGYDSMFYNSMITACHES